MEPMNRKGTYFISFVKMEILSTKPDDNFTFYFGRGTNKWRGGRGNQGHVNFTCENHIQNLLAPNSRVIPM